MIYFDTACIAKCYLNEPHAELVRNLARESSGLCSCEWARVEFAAVLHRNLRERHLTLRNVRQILRRFGEDEEAGVWTWFPLTSDLLARTAERLVALPANAFVRSADALHLTCAAENGFEDIYSNDRHLLGAAHRFGLRGIDVLAGHVRRPGPEGKKGRR